MLRGSDGNLAKWDYESCYYLNYSVNIAERIICLSVELAENVKLLTRKNIRANIHSKFCIEIKCERKAIFISKIVYWLWSITHE